MCVWRGSTRVSILTVVLKLVTGRFTTHKNEFLGTDRELQTQVNVQFLLTSSTLISYSTSWENLSKYHGNWSVVICAFIVINNYNLR